MIMHTYVVYMYVCACVRACVSACVRAYVRACVHACVGVCMWVCACGCVVSKKVHKSKYQFSLKLCPYSKIGCRRTLWLENSPNLRTAEAGISWLRTIFQLHSNITLINGSNDLCAGLPAFACPLRARATSSMSFAHSSARPTCARILPPARRIRTKCEKEEHLQASA